MQNRDTDTRSNSSQLKKDKVEIQNNIEICKNCEYIRWNFDRYYKDYGEDVESWNTVKKFIYPILGFTNVILIIGVILNNELQWYTRFLVSLIIFLLTAGFGFIAYSMIIFHKSHLIEKISQIYENESIEFEKYNKPIDCSPKDRASLFLIYSCLYLLILILGIWNEDPDLNPKNVYYITFGILFFYGFILPGFFSKNFDRIKVNPKNQTFLVKKKILFMIFGKEHEFSWSEISILAVKNRVEVNKLKLGFSRDFKSNFHADNDYIEIIPKAFKSLRDGNEIDKNFALKMLAMYRSSLKRKMAKIYIICISLAIIEFLLLFT